MRRHDLYTSVLLSLLVNVYGQAGQWGPVVRTQNGLVRGSIEKDVVGGDYHSFKGIPFAAPPVGDLRFKDPQPPESWTGVRNATTDSPACAQMLYGNYYGEEDCLYLNVYSKNIEPKSPLPVMVWVHGGGYHFEDGHSPSYGPDYILRRDVIMITHEYRLSILGFIDLQDEVAPGNVAMKDMVMVLKWVRDNIANFGGDPQRVTVFGESASAAAVHFLALSPMTKGLIHGVICQSGVAISPWAYKPRSQNYTYQVAELLGKKSRDPKELIDFLRSVDSSKLQEAARKIVTPEMSRVDDIIFGPTTDNKSEQPFFPEDLTVAAARGVQMPFLLGYNSREGIARVKGIRENGLDKYNNDFASILQPAFLDLLKQYKLSPEELKNLYFKGAKITEQNWETLFDLLTDVIYKESAQRAVAIQVQNSSFPTYLYQYSFHYLSDPLKLIIKTNASGACHADELVLLFKRTLFEELSITEPIRKGTPRFLLMLRMTDLWVNFATTGNPTPAKTRIISEIWQPVNDSMNIPYYDIDRKLKMKTTKNLKLLYDHSQQS